MGNHCDLEKYLKYQYILDDITLLTKTKISMKLFCLHMLQQMRNKGTTLMLRGQNLS